MNNVNTGARWCSTVANSARAADLHRLLKVTHYVPYMCLRDASLRADLRNLEEYVLCTYKYVCGRRGVQVSDCTREGCRFDLHSGECYLFLISFLRFATHSSRNASKIHRKLGFQSVLTLDPLCLLCYMRDTAAWSWKKSMYIVTESNTSRLLQNLYFFQSKILLSLYNVYLKF